MLQSFTFRSQRIVRTGVGPRLLWDLISSLFLPRIINQANIPTRIITNIPKVTPTPIPTFILELNPCLLLATRLGVVVAEADIDEGEEADKVAVAEDVGIETADPRIFAI